MRRYTTSVTIQITIEATVEVEGVYIPPVDGQHYTPSGDPGNPPQYPEFHIDKISWQGMDITKALRNEDFDLFSLEDEIVNKILDE